MSHDGWKNDPMAGRVSCYDREVVPKKKEQQRQQQQQNKSWKKYTAPKLTISMVNSQVTWFFFETNWIRNDWLECIKKDFVARSSRQNWASKTKSAAQTVAPGPLEWRINSMIKTATGSKVVYIYICSVTFRIISCFLIHIDIDFCIFTYLKYIYIYVFIYIHGNTHAHIYIYLNIHWTEMITMQQQWANQRDIYIYS